MFIGIFIFNRIFALRTEPELSILDIINTGQFENVCKASWGFFCSYPKQICNEKSTHKLPQEGFTLMRSTNLRKHQPQKPVKVMTSWTLTIYKTAIIFMKNLTMITVTTFVSNCSSLNSSNVWKTWFRALLSNDSTLSE